MPQAGQQLLDRGFFNLKLATRSLGPLATEEIDAGSNTRVADNEETELRRSSLGRRDGGWLRRLLTTTAGHDTQTQCLQEKHSPDSFGARCATF